MASMVSARVTKGKLATISRLYGTRTFNHSMIKAYLKEWRRSGDELLPWKRDASNLGDVVVSPDIFHVFLGL
jgi:hypothetical protein